MFPGGELPKGMTLPQPQQEEQPRPVSLADGNYVGAIYQALEILPLTVRIDRCQVIEGEGIMPQVELSLTITGERVPAARARLECTCGYRGAVETASDGRQRCPMCLKEITEND